MSAVTTNHDLKLFRKMFGWFERNNYIEQTPFRFRGQVAIKLDRETPRNQRFADSKIESRLLAAAEPLLHDIIVAMLDTCCRPGEILKLQWMDVDFLRKELTIRPANCKTREGRVLPITKRLLAILEARRLGADGQRRAPTDFVFGDETGSEVKSVRRIWVRACAKAELVGLHLADLRHEAGSRYEEAGMPTTYVSKMLGHRNLATTTRYLNPTTHHLHREIERVDEARRKAADAANSLQTPAQPAPQPAGTADFQPAQKSLIS